MGDVRLGVWGVGKCLWEVFVWGFRVLFLSCVCVCACVCVCQCHGCCSMSVCVCDLLIFLNEITPRERALQAGTGVNSTNTARRVWADRRIFFETAAPVAGQVRVNPSPPFIDEHYFGLTQALVITLFLIILCTMYRSYIYLRSFYLSIYLFVLYICIYTYMYIYVYIYPSIYLYYIYVYIHICIYMYICIYSLTPMHRQAQLHTRGSRKRRRGVCV